jgi:hypothetical protein
LIRVAEENRLRLQMVGQTLENLRAVINASQNADMRRPYRRFAGTAKSSNADSRKGQLPYPG